MHSYLLFPKVSYATVNLLPQSPGVYFVYASSTETLIYIGESENLRDRHQRHEYEALFHQHKADTIYYVPTSSKEVAYAIQNEQIAVCKPLLNVQGQVAELPELGGFSSVEEVMEAAVEAKREFDDAKARLDAFNNLMAVLLPTFGDKYKTSCFTITYSQASSYSYTSEEWKALDAQIRELDAKRKVVQDREKAQGTAIATLKKPGIRYTLK